MCKALALHLAIKQQQMLLQATLSTTLSASEASRPSIFPLHKPPRDPGCESRSRSYTGFMSHVADHMMRACMIDLGDEMQIQTATLGLYNDGYNCLIWAKCIKFWSLSGI